MVSKPHIIWEQVYSHRRRDVSGFLPKSLFDQTICFYTDDHTELERRLSRDVAQRNREIDFIYQTHQIRREQYHHYYQPMEGEADILVNTSQDQFRIEKKNKKFYKEAIFRTLLNYFLSKTI